MAKQQRSEGTKIITPKFRVAFPHVFKASSMPGTNNAPKYSVTMLFPKDTDMASMKEAIRLAKVDKFGENKKAWPAMASPVTDGDAPEHDKKEGYKGHYVIKASTNEDQRPGVVDRDGEDILKTEEFYPGCYARAAVMAYVWEFPKGSGKYGVSFILDHVQKLGDGKTFGGKKPASQVFGRVEDTDEVDKEIEEDTDDFA